MATPSDAVRVQVLIRRDTPHGRFHDAIYLSMAEFEAMKDSELEALQDERVGAWISAVEDAKHRAPEKPTRAELEEARARALSEVAEIEGKLSRGDHKIVSAR